MSQLQLAIWSGYRQRLKDPINAIARRAQQPELWSVIDHACTHQTAFLFVADEGFVVLRPCLAGCHPYIEILVAFSHGTHSIPRYFPTLCRLARMGAAEWLEFSSVRPGYQRVMTKLGWEMTSQQAGRAVWRYQLTGGWYGRHPKGQRDTV